MPVFQGEVVAEAVQKAGQQLAAFAAAVKRGLGLNAVGGGGQSQEPFSLGGGLAFGLGLIFLLDLAVPFLLVQGEGLGAVIVAAELGEFAVDLAKALEAFVEVRFPVRAGGRRGG